MNGVLERTLGILELLAQHGEGMEMGPPASLILAAKLNVLRGHTVSSFNPTISNIGGLSPVTKLTGCDFQRWSSGPRIVLSLSVFTGKKS